jgi:hypothetical protein
VVHVLHRQLDLPLQSPASDSSITIVPAVASWVSFWSMASPISAPGVSSPQIRRAAISRCSTVRPMLSGLPSPSRADNCPDRLLGGCGERDHGGELAECRTHRQCRLREVPDEIATTGELPGLTDA